MCCQICEPGDTRCAKAGAKYASALGSDGGLGLSKNDIKRDDFALHMILYDYDTAVC